MLYPTTITAKWQMTIPKQVRKTLGLKRPGRAVLSVEPKQKTITIQQPPSIFDLAGTFVPKGKRRKVNVVKTRDYFERHYGRTG